jgi:hypothetical protein
VIFTREAAFMQAGGNSPSSSTPGSVPRILDNVLPMRHSGPSLSLPKTTG